MTDLVLLPGLDGTATMHAEFLSACTAFESASAIAYPRHELLNYDDLEKLVRTRLPADKPFVLLGESFSGPIALSIAADPPANLVGLVLCASFGSSPLPHLASLSPVLSLLPVHHAPRRLLAWWLLGAWTTPRLEQSLHSALLSVSADVLRYRARTALRLQPKDWRRIDIPSLYLRAKDDRLMPRAVAAQLKQPLRHCHIVDIPGPHLLLQANPLPAAQAVCTFLNELST